MTVIRRTTHQAEGGILGSAGTRSLNVGVAGHDFYDTRCTKTWDYGNMIMTGSRDVMILEQIMLIDW